MVYECWGIIYELSGFIWGKGAGGREGKAEGVEI